MRRGRGVVWENKICYTQRSKRWETEHTAFDPRPCGKYQGSFIYINLCVCVCMQMCKYGGEPPKMELPSGGRPLVVQASPLGECSRNPSVSVYQLALLWEAVFSFSEYFLHIVFKTIDCTNSEWKRPSLTAVPMINKAMAILTGPW